MSSRSLLSVITNTTTRLTLATAIALTFATVLATAGDDEPAQDVAKSVDAKHDSAKKGEAPPPPTARRAAERLARIPRLQPDQSWSQADVPL